MLLFGNGDELLDLSKSNSRDASWPKLELELELARLRVFKERVRSFIAGYLDVACRLIALEKPVLFIRPILPTLASLASAQGATCTCERP